MTDSTPLAVPGDLEALSLAYVAEFAAAERSWKDVATSLLRSWMFLVGAGIVLFWIVVALFWPLIVPYSPFESATATLAPPSAAHWFGTDDLGRDVLTRVLAGASSVLTIAPAAIALALVVGTSLGLTVSYYRGWMDDVVMRLLDVLLSFPGIITAALILSTLGSSTFNMILVVAIFNVAQIARTVRSVALDQREREYVQVAWLRGEPSVYTMFVEMLPNVTAPLLVEATQRLGYAVFAVATLSFLGLGLRIPSPDWGLTVALERSYAQVAPWTVLFPALALASLLIGVNAAAEGLTRALGEF
jgi:peptide/nickel transport system permease protein